MFIGIINREEINKDSYINLVKEFKCRSIILNENNINLIDRCSGFILPGGNNFTIDKEIIEYSIEKDIPLLGICLGMQAIGCYKKNSILVDKTILNNDLNHNKKDKYVHDIKIEKKSKLYKIINKESIRVNSRHNYHIEKFNDFIISSQSKDGIIESIEVRDKTFILGVQWHPEDMFLSDNDQYKLLKYYIEECRRFYEKNKRAINCHFGSFRGRKRYNL